MNEVPVQLLRATLQHGGRGDPSPECLDAETLAAWADDTIGRDERRAAEAHAADCGRCQALIAAMAQTAPPAMERAWWRAPLMGWLVPLTAAAAALLVWVIVPGTPRGPSSRLASNTIEQEPPASSAAVQPPDISLPPPAADAARVNSPRETAAARGNARRSAADRSNSAPAAMAKALSEVAGAVPPAPSMPRPAASALPQQPAETDRTAPGGPPVGGQRAAVAQLELTSARTLLLEARRLTTVIAATSPDSQWRIMANGAVQHSTDGGTTWELQPTGVTVMLTAGASPAPSICWLVGPKGIVLLSTDGRSWRRIAFPDSADLTSVRATDDRSATVNTSDGRAFSTTDGGQTWTR